MIDLITTQLCPASTVDEEDRYNTMLDECYPDCNIAGYAYRTSMALREIDPTTYRCGLCDFVDSEYTEVNGQYYLKYEIEQLLDNN
jgi:hypothetical protein